MEPQEHNGQETSLWTTWMLRATMWELLGLSFNYPTKELAQAYASGQWREAALEVAEGLGVALPEGWGTLDDDAQADPDDLLHTLHIESTRLFFHPERPLASPYESVWVSGKNGAEALTFISPSAMSVERFARGLGLTRKEGTNDSMDTIGTECEILEYLAALIGHEESPVHYELSYAQFLGEHAQGWMTDFADCVIASSRLAFFRDAGELLKAFLPVA